MVGILSDITSAAGQLASLAMGKPNKAVQEPYHPLSPLSPDELRHAAQIVRTAANKNGTTSSLRFKASEHSRTKLTSQALTLLEPPKKDLVAYLLATRKGTAPPLPRQAQALVSHRTEDATVYTEYIISLDDSRVLSSRPLEKNEHAPLDPDEQVEAEQILLNDPEFIKVVKKLNLPEGSVVVGDSWPVSHRPASATLADVLVRYRHF